MSLTGTRAQRFLETKVVRTVGKRYLNCGKKFKAPFIFSVSLPKNYYKLSGKFVQLISKCISGTFGFRYPIEGGFLLRYTNFGPIGSFPS